MAERVVIDEDWQRVSPRYVVEVLVRWLVVGVVLVGASLAMTLGAHWRWAWILVAVFGIATIVQAILAPRRARAIGYLLRADDLLLRRGIAYLRFVAVPYGRMQLIDVARGPISRALGLSRLRFVTASAASDVELPGLRAADAESLRDRLVALAETRRGGL